MKGGAGPARGLVTGALRGPLPSAETRSSPGMEIRGRLDIFRMGWGAAGPPCAGGSAEVVAWGLLVQCESVPSRAVTQGWPDEDTDAGECGCWKPVWADCECALEAADGLLDVDGRPSESDDGLRVTRLRFAAWAASPTTPAESRRGGAALNRGEDIAPCGARDAVDVAVVAASV